MSKKLQILRLVSPLRIKLERFLVPFYFPLMTKSRYITEGITAIADAFGIPGYVSFDCVNVRLSLQYFDADVRFLCFCSKRGKKKLEICIPSSLGC
jgi:hypothetical protein